MRTLFLLLFLLASLPSAEPEIITLTDGRVMTGIYDEDNSTITITTGKATAVIPLKAADIKSRTLLNPPPPERDLIAEAVQLEAQQNARAAQREIQREIQAAEDRKRRIEADRQSRIEEERLKEQIAQQAERTKAESEQREAQQRQREIDRITQEKIDEEDRQFISRRKEQFEKDRAQDQFEQAQREKKRLSDEDAREQKRHDESVASQRELERQLATEAWWKSFWAFVIYSALGLFVLFIWAFPSILADYRRYEKRWEIMILLILTLLAGIGGAVTKEYGGSVVIVIAGPGITAMGWLGALAWVLIASKPRVKT